MKDRELALRVQEALFKTDKVEAIRSATTKKRLAKRRAFQERAFREMSEAMARRAKEESLKRLEELLQLFTEKMKERGAHVVRCKDADEARRYIVELALNRGVKLVVKAKSMVSEEIRLNEALEGEGIEVIETDLGERIVQLACERPSHIIAPAIHKTRQEVAELFSRAAGRRVEPELESLAQEARRSLREAFLKADMGVTGVNIAIAETGSLVLVTNEGNGRLVSSLPRIYVAVMGIEKIVKSVEEALAILQVLPRSGTGQKLTSYVSFLQGHLPGIEGRAKELHILILDNGREDALRDEHFREALYCIKCGACLNVCPTYGVLGGHVFGHIYSGPIGIPWTAFTSGIREAGAFVQLCISCGLCEEACPVGIDIPKLIMLVKERQIEVMGQPISNSFIARIEVLSRWASRIAPLSNLLLQNRVFRYFLELFFGIDRRRPFPSYSKKSLEAWFKSYRPKGGRKVAYFADLYANYNEPRLGVGVVRVLERNGCYVVMPKQKGSGMPLLAYGNVKLARPLMEFNVRSLARLVAEGYDIVTAEPTAAYCLKHLYPALLGTEEAKRVAERSHELFEYLLKLKGEGALDEGFLGKLKGRVGYHAPCHTKSLFADRPVERFLRWMGLEVRFLDHGCCGIAGTFGFKKGALGFDLSMKVGEPLFEDAKSPDLAYIVTESSVCRMQLELGAGRKVVHPLELLARAYGISM